MKLDRKSWRLLWLGVGLLGLLWLINRPPTVPSTSTPARGDIEELVEALWSADAVGVNRALAAGMSADQALDHQGTRPLHVLFFGPGCSLDQRPTGDGTLAVLELLLTGGADVNLADARNNTPLMMAAAECDARVVQRLLQAGADMYATNRVGLTPFEMTLSNVSDAAEPLLAAGFRLRSEQVADYQAIYHDEPEILDLVVRAAP